MDDGNRVMGDRNTKTKQPLTYHQRINKTLKSFGKRKWLKKEKEKKELNKLHPNEIIISMQQSKTIFTYKIHVKI